MERHELMRLSAKKIVKRVLSNDCRLTSIEYLLLCNNRLRPCEATQLFAALAHNTCLQTLVVSNARLEGVHAQTLASALSGNCALQTLDLDDNRIGNAGALALARLLCANTALQTLNVANNNITEHGWQALSSSLRSNKTLRGLVLNGNRCSSDDGIDALSAALRRNHTLAVLHLNCCDISDAAGRAFIARVRQPAALTNLSLYKNKLASGFCETLAKWLADTRRCQLQILDLAHNAIGSDGTRILCKAMQRNRTLTTLDVSDNCVADAGARALSRALVHNTTLADLNLCHNYITDCGAKHLHRALCRNNALHTLNLRRNPLNEPFLTSFACGNDHYDCFRPLFSRNAFDILLQRNQICSANQKAHVHCTLQLYRIALVLLQARNSIFVQTPVGRDAHMCMRLIAAQSILRAKSRGWVGWLSRLVDAL